MTAFPLLAALALAAGPISLQYDGSLKDALKQIASKGNLSVVVAGDLDEPVQVHLTDISAEEALQSMAGVYGLTVTREGKLFILRKAAGGAAHATPAPAPPAPRAAAAPEPPEPPDVPEPPEAADAPDVSSAVERAQAAAERVREQAEAAREKAQELREKAQELAEAQREKAQAHREKAQALKEMARANAQLQRVGAGGPVRVEAGTTVDTAVAYGGPVIVEKDATVEGDVVAFGGDVVLEENAVVDGDAVAFGGSVRRGSGSVVRGETVSMGGAGLGSAFSRGLIKPQRGNASDSDVSDSRSSKGNRVAVTLLQFALFFGLGFLLKMFVPQRMRALEETISAEPVKNGMAGLLGLLAFVPAFILLCVTLVGIPVAILMVLATPLAVAVGGTAVASTLGGVIPTGRLRKTQALALGLGLAVFLVAWQIPVLGVLAVVAGFSVGLGAVLRTRFGQPTRGTPIFEGTASAAPAGP